MIRKKTMNRVIALLGIVAVLALAFFAIFAFASETYAQAEIADGNYVAAVRTADRETTGTENADSAEAKTENTVDNTKSTKAIAAAIVVGLAAAAGAIAMGFAISKSNEAISRQPEASSKISSGLMLGLVFIETAIIYALIVAILIIFVL